MSTVTQPTNDRIGNDKSFLFNSTNLRSLLGVKMQSNSKKPNHNMKKIMQNSAKLSLELANSILQQETGIVGGMRSGGMKKKVVVKHKSMIPKRVKRGKKSKIVESLVDEVPVIGPSKGYDQCKAYYEAMNNVYTFATIFGLNRDDISSLERSLSKINVLIASCCNKLQSGYDQLIGESLSNDKGLFTLEDAGILIAYANIEIEDEDFNSICEYARDYEKEKLLMSQPSSKAIVDSDLISDEHIIIKYDVWLKGVTSFLRKRLMACVVAERKGVVMPGYIETKAIAPSIPAISQGNNNNSNNNDLFNGSGLQRMKMNKSGPINSTNKVKNTLRRPSSQGDKVRDVLPPVKGLKNIHKKGSKKKIVKQAFVDPNADSNSIIEKVNLLRRELQDAQKGVSALTSALDENIAWVHSNIETTTNINISGRTKDRCRKVATERFVNAVESHLTNTRRWGFNRWRDFKLYHDYKKIGVLYQRSKSIEILTRVIRHSLSRQYFKGWVPWMLIVKKQQRREQVAAAIEIGRLIRGFIGRKRYWRIYYNKAVIPIQCMFRVVKAKMVVRKRRIRYIKKAKDRAARRLVEFFRGIVAISYAKSEADRRRRIRAAIKIQKIHRGIRGRAKFKRIKAYRVKMNAEYAAEVAAKEAAKAAAKAEQERITEQKRKEAEEFNNKKGMPGSMKVSVDANKKGASVNTSKTTAKEIKTPSRDILISFSTSMQPEKANPVQDSPVSTDHNEKVTPVVDNFTDGSVSNQKVEIVTESKGLLAGLSQGINSILGTGASNKEEDKAAAKLQAITRGRQSRVKSKQLLDNKKEKGALLTVGADSTINEVAADDAKPDSRPNSKQSVMGGFFGNKTNTAEKVDEHPKSRGTIISSGLSMLGGKKQDTSPKAATVANDTVNQAKLSTVQENTETAASVAVKSNVKTTPEKVNTNQPVSSTAKDKSSPTVSSSTSKDKPSPAALSTSKDKPSPAALSTSKDKPSPTASSSTSKDKPSPAHEKKSPRLNNGATSMSSNVPMSIPATSTQSTGDSKGGRIDQQPETSSSSDIKSNTTANTGGTLTVETSVASKAPEAVVSPGTTQKAMTPTEKKPTFSMPSYLTAVEEKPKYDQVQHVEVELTEEDKPVMLKPILDDNDEDDDNDKEELDISKDAVNDMPIESDTISQDIKTEDAVESPPRSSSPIARRMFDSLSSGIQALTGRAMSPNRSSSPSSLSSPAKKEMSLAELMDKDTTNPNIIASPVEVKERPPSRIGSMLSNMAKSAAPLASAALKTAKSVGSTVKEQIQRVKTPKVSPKKVWKSLKPLPSADEAILRIQLAQRCRVARAKVALRRTVAMKRHKNAGKLIWWAVVTIQRHARARQGRKRMVGQRLMVTKQREEKKKRSILLIQRIIRGFLGRRRFAKHKKRIMEERRVARLTAMYNKGGRKGNKDSKKGEAAVDGSKSSRPGSRANNRKSGNDADDERGDDNEDDDDDEQRQLFAEKMKKLEDMEKAIQDREKSLIEATKAAEARNVEMQRMLDLMEERRLKTELEMQAQKEMLEQVLSGQLSGRSGFNSARSNRSNKSKRSFAREHSAPPTARSARDGIPDDAAIITYEGNKWVQLWDPDEKSNYWYCEKTKEAQWNKPGEESDYDSQGGMTDYTSDNYSSGGETTYSGYGDGMGASEEWQEFWDEQAQAKYWYNNITGEATWQRPGNMWGNLSARSASKIPAAAKGNNAGEWVSYIDDATGQEYWYNAVTGESSW